MMQKQPPDDHGPTTEDLRDSGHPLVTQARLLDEIQTESEAFDRQADAYGFKECGHR